MKAEWKWKRLGDVCKTGSGGTPLKERKEYFQGGEIPWLMSGEVAQGEVTKSERFITKLGMENSAAKLFPINTVLVAMYGATAGQVGLLRFEATTNQAVCGIFPSSHFIPQFLFYFFLSQKSDLIAQAIGNAQPNISQAKIKDTLVPLLPLEEQRRTVAVLDEAFAAIATATANAEKNLANARELFENALGAAFGDMASTAPERAIGEIAAIKGGKRVPKGYKLLSEATPYPYLTVGDFTEDGTIDPSGVRYVAEDIHNQIKRYIVRSEDLYVSIAGTIGRTGIVPPEFDGAQLTENACRLVFKEGISNKFVYFYTKSDAFRVQAIEQTRTAAQPKLALSRLEQIRLPIPDAGIQKTSVERFSELQATTAHLEEQATRKLELLATLKQSLLHRAFTGELTSTARRREAA